MAQAPTVGNVLGVALLCRDHKALLCLERRTLHEGVRVCGYEAEVHGVEFPMRAPTSPAALRHRRSDAIAVELQADLATMARWIRAGLLGRRVGPLTVADACFDMRTPLGPEHRGPALTLLGSTRTEPWAWLRLAVILRVRGHLLEITSGGCWWLGREDVDPDALCDALTSMLCEGDDSGHVSPVQETLGRALVRAGWKAPRLDRLGLHGATTSDREIRLAFAEHGTRTLTLGVAEQPDPVTEATHAIRAALDRQDVMEAVTRCNALAQRLVFDEKAAAAAWQWAVRIGFRAALRDDALSTEVEYALSGWLAHAPDDRHAQRMRFELLTARGSFEKVASDLAKRDDGTTPFAALARGALHLDRLDDPTTARGLLERAHASLGDSEQTSRFAPEASALLARAHADNPSKARAHLQAALRGDEHDSARSLRVAQALLERGHAADALAVASEALEHHGSDAQLLALAERAAHEANAPARALDFMRARLQSASEDQAPALRRAVADLALDLDHPMALTYVERALGDDPDAIDLLEPAATLHRAHGDDEAALERLTRLRDLVDSAEEEARLRVTAARIRCDLDQDADAIWNELQPGLGALPSERQDESIMLAVEVAPSIEVEAWIRRLRPRIDPDALLLVLRRRWARRPRPDAATEALFEALNDVGASAEASALCERAAEASEGRARALWLARAASRTDEESAAGLLDAALRCAPHDHSLTERLLAQLDLVSESIDLQELWQARAYDEALPDRLRVDAVDHLLSGKRPSDHNPIDRARQDADLASLYRLRLTLDDDHAEAHLVIAALDEANDEPQAADAHRERALELLADDDPRGGDAARSLGIRALSRGEADRAAQLLQRAVRVTPDDPRGWSKLAEAAMSLGDIPLQRHARQGELDNSPATSARSDLMLELARLAIAASDPNTAITWLNRVENVVIDGSPRQVEVAETWLTLVRDGTLDPDQEALARASVRTLMGAALPVSEHRAEALLQARIGQPERALDMLETQLSTHHDALLLSTYKQIALEHDVTHRYASVLQRTTENMPQGGIRDTLLTEQATMALELGDATTALAALDALQEATAERPDLLDLRDWAVHELGCVDDEMRRVAQRLRRTPDDPLALERLRRLVNGDLPAMCEQLLGIATPQQGPAQPALVLQALALALRCDDGPLLRRAVRRAFDLAPHDLRVREAWSTTVERAFAHDDPDGLADLLLLPVRDPGGAGIDRQRLDALLRRGLLAYPSARRLYAVLRARHPTDPSALAVLGGLAEQMREDARDPVVLYIGFASQLDHADAVTMLQAHARAHEHDRNTLRAIAEALAQAGHVPEQLAVLERAAELAPSDAARVEALKQLAHVASESLGDHARATRHLEAAAVLAPSDPDLLLPLLEHAFEQPSLGPIVNLASRTLEHIAMGDMGFVALAHRTADAALARGDHQAALRFLEQAHERDAHDLKTQQRIEELRTRARDPQRRAAMLQQVAQRQHGDARLDALEERARLLAGPLEQPRQAIRELTAILREAPHREAASDALAQLLEAHEDWRDLVELLERRVPRVYGVARCEMLQRIAEICRSRLRDLPRAEQALRIALEHLGDDPQHTEFADRMRAALAHDLEGQGRFVDLAIFLERSLQAEIAGTQGSTVSDQRGALLEELARIYRGPLDDEAKASRIYERLEDYGRLPDEGLPTLARTYQRAGRHEDLVRILEVRHAALRDDPLRQATVAKHVAQLLEHALGRPREAASYYLHAYLAAPKENREAGIKARVLLSGTDAIANVRRRLHARLEQLDDVRRPALHTLLGDLLAVHDAYETEAEKHYERAVATAPEPAEALEALGRLRLRQGRHEDAIGPLVDAASDPNIDGGHAAEIAVLAARALLELGREDDAEVVLDDALSRAPGSIRALRTMVGVLERTGRLEAQEQVLERLAQLPLPSMLEADVSYRRASLLLPAVQADPFGSQAEQARTLLLNAVAADAKHAAARQAVIDLAHMRHEWKVVVHMHYLALRELPEGAARAAHHLDLAQTYIEQLDDVDAAMRNVEAAIAQAPHDVVISTRAASLTTRLPDPGRIAERLEKIADGAGTLDDPARARLWMLAADLRLDSDDAAGAGAAAAKVLDLPEAGDELTAAAHRSLHTLEGDTAQDLLKQKAELLRRAEQESSVPERILVFGQLRELGRALDDPALVVSASEEQLALAAGHDDAQDEQRAATAALRDAYAERGAYADIVALYERIAASSEGEAKAEALLEAARFGWTALRDATRALRALHACVQLTPTDPAMLALIAEVIGRGEDVGEAESIYEALTRVDAEQRSPSFDLQLAALASDLGRDPDAATILRPLCSRDDDEIRFLALTQLDVVLARSGSTTDRVEVTRKLLTCCIDRNSSELPAVALDLARAERTLAGADRARDVVARGLQADPAHLELLVLHAELAAEAEDWDALAQAHGRLATLASDPDVRAHHYLAAGQAFVELSGTSERLSRGRTLQQARVAFESAAESAPNLPDPSVRLLPLAFAESRWDDVLDLAVEIRERAGPYEEVLVLAALTEAYRHGQRSLARDLGVRHGAQTTEQYIFPGLRQLLTVVATRGPLPRLDALLAAAGALMGGRGSLTTALGQWSSGRPLQAGLALGLARLAEAAGRAERARNLYQITAFMVPDGTVPSLVARLPFAQPPDDLDPVASGPLEGGSTLRRVLVRSREALAGVTTTKTSTAQPNTSGGKARFALAESIVGPWRASLGVELPLAWTHARMPGGVGVANHRPPTIVLSAGVTVCSLAELRFRLARATATIVAGLAVLETGDTCTLADLLDGLGRAASPSHVPTGRAARAITEALETDASAFPVKERASLAEELSHWLTASGGITRLDIGLRRARMLFATRLCGQLDGALLTLAHDHGFESEGRPDPLATLRHEDAYWLLRALDLY